MQGFVSGDGGGLRPSAALTPEFERKLDVFVERGWYFPEDWQQNKILQDISLPCQEFLCLLNVQCLILMGLNRFFFPPWYYWKWPFRVQNAFFIPSKDSLSSFVLYSYPLKKRMISPNVMVINKGCFGTALTLQEKPWACVSLCEWHCLCFTYLWQMLAEWNWIPGNEGERSRRASSFISGARISPGRPWSLDCLPWHVVGG